MKKTRLSRKFKLALLLVIAASLVAELATRTGWLEMPEHITYDLFHQLAGVRYQPEHVVIAAIDDQTLLEHYEEPMAFWGPHFARAIEVMRNAGARVIGLDYLFSVSAESWLSKLGIPGSDKSRTYDIPLRVQLASGQVVLASNVVTDASGKQEVLLPIRDYLFSLPQGLDGVGAANLFADPDGVVRRFLPELVEDGGKTLGPTFAALLAEHALQTESSEEGKAPPDQNFLKSLPAVKSDGSGAFPPAIGFVGPPGQGAGTGPGTFPRLSFRRLLDPQAETDPEVQRLKGKVVIVGSESSALLDIHLTPYARGFFGLKPRMMGGAELHANIVETLLTGRFPRPVPSLLRVFCLVVFLAVGTILFLELPPWQGFGVGIAICILSTASSYLLFRVYWVLPVAGVQLGLAASYLGTLALRLTGEERERARLRQMFGRYVSDEVVEKLLGTGRMPDLGGEGVCVTVLFADIRNFTTISEQLAPHEVLEMLNTYLSRVCEPILEQGGTVDKFIGDGIMAVFGSPVLYEDHAQRALRAALGIAREAGDFSSWMEKRFEGRNLTQFRIGIGLHLGDVVAGNVGSPRRLEYTAIGDAVNTASRIEGLTKELGWGIAASREVIDAANLAVVTRNRAKLNVKGRKEPVEVFEVIDMV